MKKTVSFILCLLLVTFLSAQAYISTQPHAGKINSSTVSEDALFTAGDDGFVIKWTMDGNGERYQVSDLEVKLIAVSPNGNDIAIYETDGYSINRLSVWSWKTKTRKFNPKRISDTITSLTYSEKGTYIIAGTSSVSGSVFINATNGMVLSKQSEPPTMVSMTYTSATEKSSVMYSPLGTLTYTNLQNGANKVVLSVENDLTQPILFNNDLFFAGVKNNYIYIYHAVTGTQLAKFQATNPLIASRRDDTNLYYVEGNGRNYSLKYIETDVNRVFSSPTLVSNFSIVNKPSLIKVLKAQDMVYGICSNGSVHMISTEPQSTLITMTEISKPVFNKINDIGVFNDVFYFLTDERIFTSTSYDDDITVIGQNSGYSNLIPTAEGIILWSQNTSGQIVLKNGNSTRNLYKPSGAVQNMHYADGKLLIIEGNNTVKQLTISNAAITTLYTGSGVQDAILTSDQDLYVAKTASTSPNSALIHVDLVTQETVSCPVTGDVMYSLSLDEENGVLYGVNVISSPSKKTDIFSYRLSNKTYRTLLYWSDEDTEAFTFINDGRIITNIGHTQLRSRSTVSSSEIQYTRFNALPQKVTGTEEYLLSLNKDGSISWYNPTFNQRYKTSFLSTDNQSWLTD